MEAVKIGTSRAGVEYVNYPRTGDTPETFEARSQTMRKRLRAQQDAFLDKVVRVRLTEAQMALVWDEITRVDLGLERPAGRTFMDMPRGMARYLAEGIEATRLDEGEIESMIMWGADKDLTDAQVIFGTKQAVKSAKATIAALRGV